MRCRTEPHSILPWSERLLPIHGSRGDPREFTVTPRASAARHARHTDGVAGSHPRPKSHPSHEVEVGRAPGRRYCVASSGQVRARARPSADSRSPASRVGEHASRAPSRSAPASPTGTMIGGVADQRAQAADAGRHERVRRPAAPPARPAPAPPTRWAARPRPPPRAGRRRRRAAPSRRTGARVAAIWAVSASRSGPSPATISTTGPVRADPPSRRPRRRARRAASAAAAGRPRAPSAGRRRRARRAPAPALAARRRQRRRRDERAAHQLGARPAGVRRRGRRRRRA